MKVIEVEGANGNYDTNFVGKADAAINALRSGYDFAYVHMEAPDECGHQGDLEHKIFSIEQIDKYALERIKTGLDEIGEDYAILFMPDHPTPLSLKTHVSDPVPYLLYKSYKPFPSSANKYDEENAANSGNYVALGYEIIKKLFD